MTNLTEVLVPDVGDFEDIPVIEVLVSPGDVVGAEDSLITLETDKASMDVPSPAAGRVKDLKLAVGDTVSQGTLILTLEPTGEAPPAEAPEPAPVQAPAQTPAQPDAPAPATPSAATAPGADSTIDDPRAPKGRPSPTATLAPEGDKSKRHAHATPGIRRYARELGVELERVTGTGRKGRILREDINGFVKGVINKPQSKGVESGIPPIPTVDFAKFGPVELRPLSRIARISGPHLHRAWLNVPHVTHHDEADITELEAFRKSLKDEAAKQGARITALTFIIKALVKTLQQFPGFNASLSADGENLVLKKYFNLGIAVDTPNGLMVPVLRDVDRKGIMELAVEIGEISAKAREGKLKSGDLQGGCMSVSSLGGIGGTAFTPIVNAPEVAILGVARARMTPVWNGSEFTPRLMLPLDLSYDHRVIDGAQGARFMAFLCTLLSDLKHLLL